MNNDKNAVKTEEQQLDEKYSALEWKKSIFTFSEEERKILKPFEDAVNLISVLSLAMDQIISLKNNFVGNAVLTRLNVKKSQDSQFRYDFQNNKIIVYEPKFWCSVCNDRKAVYKLGTTKQFYCEDCSKKEKEKLMPKIEEKEKIKESKKVEN